MSRSYHRYEQPSPFNIMNLLIALAALLIVFAAGYGLYRVAENAREQQAAYLASLVPTPVTVLKVDRDYEADDVDEAEHWVTTQELGALPISDSLALQTDDDAVARRLASALLTGERACVIIEDVQYLGQAITDVRRCAP